MELSDFLPFFNTGFSAFVAVYLLVRLETKLDALIKAVEKKCL